MSIIVGAVIILCTAAWGYISWWIYGDAERRRGSGWGWFTRAVIAGALLNVLGATLVATVWLFVRNPTYNDKIPDSLEP